MSRPPLFQKPQPVEAIVIGSSAGAITALTKLLPPLPRDCAVPIMIVVHQPADRTSTIANLFQARCSVTVKEAEDKEPLAAGTVYFAPPDYHLLVEPRRVLSLSSDEAVNYSRPAIDVLFESAADVFGPGLLGIVLTGANHDGAKGLRAICDAGGQALVQSPETAEARTMPEAALAACSKASALSLEEISQRLQEIVLPR
jgi:two-component system, chemotaxis family, protein-glutamate methylesterase/glutaminase